MCTQMFHATKVHEGFERHSFQFWGPVAYEQKYSYSRFQEVSHIICSTSQQALLNTYSNESEQLMVNHFLGCVVLCPCILS